MLWQTITSNSDFSWIPQIDELLIDCTNLTLQCTVDQTIEVNTINFTIWFRFCCANKKTHFNRVRFFELRSLKKRCSGSWFGAIFGRFKTKWKNIWDLSTFKEYWKIKRTLFWTNLLWMAMLLLYGQSPNYGVTKE